VACGNIRTIILISSPAACSSASRSSRARAAAENPADGRTFQRADAMMRVELQDLLLKL
jgi:hypothetical protein